MQTSLQYLHDCQSDDRSSALAQFNCNEMAHGSLRMTLGRGTTDEQIDYVLEVLPEIVVVGHRLHFFGSQTLM